MSCSLQGYGKSSVLPAYKYTHLHKNHICSLTSLLAKRQADGQYSLLTMITHLNKKMQIYLMFQIFPKSL